MWQNDLIEHCDLFWFGDLLPLYAMRWAYHLMPLSIVDLAMQNFLNMTEASKKHQQCPAVIVIHLTVCALWGSNPSFFHVPSHSRGHTRASISADTPISALHPSGVRGPGPNLFLPLFLLNLPSPGLTSSGHAHTLPANTQRELTENMCSNFECAAIQCW